MIDPEALMVLTQFECPHNCDIDSDDHKPGCAWRHDFTAGSRMQAVPRRETEKK